MPRKLSKIRNPYDFVHGHPRMSWAPDNLFNLYNRCYGPEARNTSFKQSPKTLFQQRWASKTMARGYHGDWLQEKRLKHHFLPSFLPHPSAASIAKSPERKFATGRYTKAQSESREPIPLTNLMWTELERRLDVLVFRANFAPSVYAARHLVIHGKVRVNGIRERNPNVKLDPGALFSVDPTAISMLHIPADVEQAKRRRLTLDEKKAMTQAEGAAVDGESAATESDEAEGTSTEASSEEASTSKEASTRSLPPQDPTASSSALPDIPLSERPNQARLAHLGGAEKVKEGEEVKVVATADERRKKAAAEGPLAFVLPDYAAPHIFVPAYLEVSYETCSAVFVRLPTARPGLSEIPSPYKADGEVAKFTLEWYAQNNKRLYKTPRTPGPYRVEFERTGLHGHGGALVAEHLATLRKPGETLEDRARRLQQRQREVMAQARRHALSKLPPHVHAAPHPTERAS